MGDEYFTSDYDLSAFSANKLGLGFRYAPLYGLGRFKAPFSSRITKFKSLDVRYGYYRQSTGLTANVVSAGLPFTMPQARRWTARVGNRGHETVSHAVVLSSARSLFQFALLQLTRCPAGPSSIRVPT
ncbi:hypothetical protein ACFQ48_21235 [Hymenobacter caeli]|uniref:TonB-dependent receptor n=1 Tax=Hymenobacter caeli TaxID=2735894 RepID=A0ABX2FYJ6_9BACT|nr:hypothetical protein [Hymenobacter caeli]